MNILLVAGIPVFGILFAFLAGFAIVITYGLTQPVRRRDSFDDPVSIIIPAYNEETTIQPCVQSFHNNLVHDESEIIVVDDGSTDDTLQEAKQTPATTIATSHDGKVAALNEGYREAAHDIIIAADADTIVDDGFIQDIGKRFTKDVGAVSGAVRPKPRQTILNAFQRVEYHYNNLIREGISRAFTTDIWFFGCIAGYRREALDAVDGFPGASMTEDMDSVIRIREHGWKTVHAAQATATTEAPTSLVGLTNQRRRWWGGGYQLIGHHDQLLGDDHTFTFIAGHHAWWAVYAILSAPLLAYQYYHWLPNTVPLAYTARWLSLGGPVGVLYYGWLSWYNAFGVFSGLLTTALITAALTRYDAWQRIPHWLATICYFPYTLVLNGFIILGLYDAVQNPTSSYRK